MFAEIEDELPQMFFSTTRGVLESSLLVLRLNGGTAPPTTRNNNEVARGISSCFGQ